MMMHSTVLWLSAKILCTHNKYCVHLNGSSRRKGKKGADMPLTDCSTSIADGESF